MKKIFLILIIFKALYAGVLQEAINKAPAYSILKLKTGIYKGNIVITKPLSIIGTKNTIIKGDKKGSVITIISDEVLLKNLIIEDSSKNYQDVDSAINAKNAKNLKIENNIIRNTLFGINLENVSDSSIKANEISSFKDFKLGLRGDALRLWYSNFNIISENKVNHSRDMVIWYSHGNVIEKNEVKNGRYGLHFMYAGANVIKNNNFEENSAGIFFMYAKDCLALNNIISKSINGIGIGLKESSNMRIENNTIFYSALALYIDRSPYEYKAKNDFLNNHLFYNDVAVQFHALSFGNNFYKNSLKGNLENVQNDKIDKKLVEKNTWLNNYFDDYKGFDVDENGVGDIAYLSFSYLDKYYFLHPNLKFFYAAPVLSLIDFLNKLNPFSKPLLLLEDKAPLTKLIALKEEKNEK